MATTLTHDEQIQILEEIARNPSNAAARIAAIKQLREMEAEGADAGDFDKLDEFTPRRKAKEAA